MPSSSSSAVMEHTGTVWKGELLLFTEVRIQNCVSTPDRFSNNIIIMIISIRYFLATHLKIA